MASNKLAVLCDFDISADFLKEYFDPTLDKSGRRDLVFMNYYCSIAEFLSKSIYFFHKCGRMQVTTPDDR